MKSMMTISFAFMLLLSIFSAMYIYIYIRRYNNSLNKLIFIVILSFEGKVVAKLPFEPISWVRGLSHRNLVSVCNT
jgi:DMSO reductase anchor subunit